MARTRGQIAASNGRIKSLDESENEPDITSDENSSHPPQKFHFQGKTYTSYEEMVWAKRKRNEDMLVSTGLLDASLKLRESLSAPRSVPSQKGLKVDRKRKTATPLPRRKSSRIAGVKSDGLYVEDERRGGRFTISGTDMTNDSNLNDTLAVNESHFNDRVNDGSDLSVKEAMELSDSKWLNDDSVSSALQFVSQVKRAVDSNPSSPSSVSSLPKRTPYLPLSSQLQQLKLDDDNCVAKVVPDRIYSVTFHPSPHTILAAAGDKSGYLGLWNTNANAADTSSSNTSGVHLFKPHNRPVTHLEWNSAGDQLFSASYDGSVRVFDIEKETFRQVFATYDDSPEFNQRLGFGLDQGYRYWVQYACLDHRHENCLFLSTSIGTVIHVDLRQKGMVTFNSQLCEKKINTVSLHPNGHTLATAGLNTEVQLWDIRKFQSSTKHKKTPTPFTTQKSTKSINSAFFSPTGKRLLTTTMNNTIDIINDAHLQTGTTIQQPTHRIRHDNHTGRWLSTFMARWHPAAASNNNEELFVVGSMQRPRTLEVFNGNTGKLLRGIQGDSLTAVVSRCCFHPSSERLIVMGGNSSGRVTVAQ